MKVPQVRRLRSDEFTEGEAIRLRAMLDVAFEGYFTDDDWEHAFGGTHVVVEIDHVIVAHASVVPRVLEVADRGLRTGYVEAVATHPTFARRGYARAALERVVPIITDTYEVGALSTAIPGFYEQFGWERWRGPTYCRTIHGVERTEDDDGGVLIFRTPRTGALDLDGPIACADREGDVW